ncbi:phosphate signaling complex protein PhoU [Clostridium sp. SM-530-WT-3G]|uniref:phosphate signaling complex protein PhoU n=1 Tax=Clostridium sp. SM-530-WT-3G TaxID=2725303 RepID=UPI00145CE2FE|nr:phosphate signaling complex protein PhoU [Clostridium sp. SM-530-WT-3G]NME81711.1 phosphate signaling complex protein PhoU [Clostridium sp. SM-530-WT-3G]
MVRQLQEARVKNITKRLIDMTSFVEKQIYESMIALKNYDIQKAEEVIKNDDIVDNMQKEIEEDCIKFIATEQPLAEDLRRVFTASKIVTDLERIADHAVDICKITKRINRSLKVFNGDIEKLFEMEMKVRSMITQSIEVYLQNDVDAAYKICKEDDKVDVLYKSLFEKMIKRIHEKEDLINDGTQLLFVIKYLERIADHVTNICEWTIFSKKGIYVDLNE